MAAGQVTDGRLRHGPLPCRLPCRLHDWLHNRLQGRREAAQLVLEGKVETFQPQEPDAVGHRPFLLGLDFFPDDALTKQQGPDLSQ